jgi:hypothetical protein
MLDLVVQYYWLHLFLALAVLVWAFLIGPWMVWDWCTKGRNWRIIRDAYDERGERRKDYTSPYGWLR